MGTKTKLTLAASFVGVVVTAAAAFGQAGGSGSGEGPDSGTREERRRAASEQRDPNACGPVRAHPRLGRLVHSETKVQVKEGFALMIVDQGEVTAIDAGRKTLSIKRVDGETVRATATDETKVCKDGQKAAFEAIKVGDLARLVQARSPERNGLIRIYVRTPGSEPAAPQRTRPTPSSARGVPADVFEAGLEFAF
jgi:hypothetical protein